MEMAHLVTFSRNKPLPLAPRTPVGAGTVDDKAE